MTWYLVESPEMDWVDVVTDDGRGPVTPYCDFALVEVPTAQAAKWEAWRLWKKHGGDWPAESSGGHPLSGVKATRWESIGDDLGPPSEKELENWMPFVSPPPPGPGGRG